VPCGCDSYDRCVDASQTVSPDLAVLSPREIEILEMIALGKTNRDIATRLGVTIHAVKFHLASIYRKLAVANRTEAAVRFSQHVAPSHSLGDVRG
jgi:DNA-binding CsgD family transcriptional regulator